MIKDENLCPGHGCGVSAVVAVVLTVQVEGILVPAQVVPFFVDAFPLLLQVFQSQRRARNCLFFTPRFELFSRPN